MIDHIGIRVSDYERAKSFYVQALQPLGYTLFTEGSSGAGFRKDMIPDFWLKLGTPAPSVHVAFSAADRAMVDALVRPRSRSICPLPPLRQS
jgi:catechol 2,3-dioxygenase-like lactoylglutathione lyase family enzyme